MEVGVSKWCLMEYDVVEMAFPFESLVFVL